MSNADRVVTSNQMREVRIFIPAPVAKQVKALAKARGQGEHVVVADFFNLGIMAHNAAAALEQEKADEVAAVGQSRIVLGDEEGAGEDA